MDDRQENILVEELDLELRAAEVEALSRAIALKVHSLLRQEVSNLVEELISRERKIRSAGL